MADGSIEAVTNERRTNPQLETCTEEFDLTCVANDVRHLPEAAKASIRTQNANLHHGSKSDPSLREHETRRTLGQIARLNPELFASFFGL